jgi:hypothetical protein
VLYSTVSRAIPIAPAASILTASASLHSLTRQHPHSFTLFFFFGNMFLKIFTLTLSLTAAVTASFVKRDETTKLYAYGKGISGYEVFAGPNGMFAYVDIRGLTHNLSSTSHGTRLTATTNT